MSTAPSTTLTRANLSEEQLVSASIASLIVTMGIIFMSQPVSSAAVAFGFVGAGLVLALVATPLTVRTRTRLVLGSTFVGFFAGAATIVLGLTTGIVLGVSFSFFGLLQVRFFL